MQVRLSDVKFYAFMRGVLRVCEVISTFAYIYVILWGLQIMTIIFFFMQYSKSVYIVCLSLFVLYNIHFFLGVTDIVKDYIFNNFLKRFYVIIFFIGVCSV